ncbi:hypothetical protein, partial [Mesorhizobium sp. M7A.F.Ca.US.005.03.2.1]|uniref:hypothetical protein n=1 Tax=Mesorhizobium sp. M7A.F.Ca.US.005.03.2.1 TaxID=2496737 RepID=UPI0019CF5C85
FRMSRTDPGHPEHRMQLANGHFAGDAGEVGRLDPYVGAVGIAHRMKQRERRAVSQMFLWPRPGEHFSEETHDSSPKLVLHGCQYR